MMDWKSFLITGSVFVFLIAVLWRINVPRQSRHKQVWLPFSALSFSVVALFLYVKFYDVIVSFVNTIITFLQRYISIPSWQANQEFPLFFNLLLLIIFLLIKISGNGVYFIPECLRKIRSLIKKSEPRTPSAQSQVGASQQIFYAYESHLERGIMLRKEWVFPGTLALYMGGLSIFLFLLSVFSSEVYKFPFELPRLPILSVLILLEFAWYLGGIRPFEKAGGIAGEDVAAQKTGSYRALWEKYQKIWPDHLLGAAEVLLPADEKVQIPYVDPGRNVDQDQEMTLAWNALIKRHAGLSDHHYLLFSRVWEGKDILVEGAVYANIAPVLFSALQRHLMNGQKILILTGSEIGHSTSQADKIVDWVSSSLSGKNAIWKVMTFDDYSLQRIEPDVIVGSPEQLIRSDRDQTNDNWFNQLRTVVAFDATSFFNEILPANILLRKLKRFRNAIQFIGLTDYRQSLEPSIRRNFLATPVENRFPDLLATESLYVILWRLEGEPFQSKVMSGDIGRYIGAEAVLALPAWQDGINDIQLVGQEHLPADEYIEEMQQHRVSIMKQPVDETKLGGDARTVISVPLPSWLISPSGRTFLLARDSEYNISTVFTRWIPLAQKSCFLHVISPPYLLRDYFADNIEYFFKTPLPALSPRISQSRHTIACSLFEQLLTGEIQETELRKLIPASYLASENTADSLRELISAAFGIDIIKNNYLSAQRSTIFNDAAESFEEEVHFKLIAGIREEKKLKWMELVEIRDMGDNVIGHVQADHVYQRYLPGQIHAFQGKHFIIDSINMSSLYMRVDQRTPVEQISYRPHLTFSLEKGTDQIIEATDLALNGFSINLSLIETFFSVKTHGYNSYRRHISIADSADLYTELNSAPLRKGSSDRHLTDSAALREYSSGRILKLTVSGGHAGHLLNGRTAFTLAVLLNEALPSLFPETHQFVKACSPYTPSEYSPSGLVPLMDSSKNDKDGAALEIFFFEDSTIDMGLVQCLYSDWLYVFKVIDDYLAWLLEDDLKQSGAWIRNVQNKEQFLTYGLAGLPAWLDLKGAKELLGLLLQGNNTLTIERRAFLGGGKQSVVIPEAGDLRLCDFCQDTLPNAEFEQLSDGRERCPACKTSAIDTVEGLKRVYDESYGFLAQELHLTMRHNVQLTFTDAQKVQAAVNERFIPTAGFDPRAVGVAIREGNDFKILIENGAPYHMTLSTTAHELTHIWQYDNLDFSKMKPEEELRLIEGHAVWSQIECLQRKNLAPKYCTMLADRQDEYGQGYRMILELLRQHAAVGNPFDILRKLYGKA